MRLSVTQFDVGNNASFVIWHCSTTQSTSPCFPNRTYFMWIAPEYLSLKLGPKVKRCLLFWPVIRIFNFTFLYYLQFLLFRNTLWNFQMNCHYVGSFIKKRLIGNRTPRLPFALISPNVFSWVHKVFAVSIVSSAKKVC